MASAISQAYNGNLEANPPAGSRGGAPGQGIRRAKPPEAEALLVFRRSMKSANLPTFLKFRNAKYQISLPKNHRWP